MISLRILTTDTPHHVRFAERLAARHPELTLVEETTALAAPFETAHRFERDRDAYEQDLWFGGAERRLGDVAGVTRFETLNDRAAVAALAGAPADVTVVFGTRRLGPAVIEAAGPNLINLHGGDPEAYRGLDTHLWAVYHGDRRGLATCLHTVNAELDDGEIIGLSPLALTSGMALHELRAVNTEVCVSLTLAALEDLERTGEIVARPQIRKGRYYSFMPAVLKEQCVAKFRRLTEEP